MDIERFVEEKRSQLHKLMDDIVDSDLTLINNDLARLQEIQKLLSIPQYRLVFIGNPGSGKTTTICNYLNLTDDDIVGKQFTNIELFNVGTGRTTAFEVHYRVGIQTEFKLYPMDIAEQETLIREYCEYEWGKAFPDSTEAKSGETSGESSREHDRIIRNMLGFKSSKEISETLARDYPQTDFAAFLEKMLQTARLSDRSVTSLRYDKSVPAKQWIKKTFSDINNGRIGNISIPERVDVFFNPQDIQINLPGNVSEVIDTRGFEGNEREDLKKYLEADDTLPILVDRPEEVPGANQKKILSDWILEEQKDIIPRVSLFVKVRENALSQVNGAEGDPDAGEEIKREEISRTIQAERLHYLSENTLFLDSYEGIVTEKRPVLVPSKAAAPQKKLRVFVSQCYEELRHDNREKVTGHIDAVIARFHEMLTREAVEIEDRTEKLIAKISAPSQNKQYADFLAKAAHSLEVLRDGLIGLADDDGRIYEAFEDFNDDFCRSFRYESNIRWNSAKKTAFMTGTWYNAQLYDELSAFTFRLSKDVLQPVKNQALLYLREDNFEDLRSFLDSCRSKTDDDYIELLNRIKANAHNIMVDAFTVAVKGSELNYNSDPSIRAHGDEACWNRIQNTPGGTGYYDRLMGAFRRRMERKKVADDITNMVIDETEAFFDDILKVLKEKISAL